MSAPAVECDGCIARGSGAYLFASRSSYEAHLVTRFIDGGERFCQDPAHMWRSDGAPVLVQDAEGRWVRNRNETLDDVRDRLRRSLQVGWDAARNERRCETCRASLAARRSNARYCSATCRNRAWREQRTAA